MTVYDDASWHYGGDFDPALPPAAAATHIGLFMGWCVTRDLHNVDGDDAGRWLFAALARRELTPGAVIIALDEKLTDDLLSYEGNAFASKYYEGGRGPSYLDDYVDVFEEVDDIYAVPDTWESLERISLVLDQRLESFRSGTK